MFTDFLLESFGYKQKTTLVVPNNFFTFTQRYTYRVLQTIQMKLILLCVWAERAITDGAQTALKFKHEIQIG